MMKLEDIKIGMKIWQIGHWSSLPESGTVKAIKYTEVSKIHPEPVPYVEVKWDNRGTSGAILDEIYPSYEELQIGEKAREDKAVAEIKSEVHNVKDLVVFMYNATLNGGEYTNYDERRAARELAKELLDLDLE